MPIIHPLLQSYFGKTQETNITCHCETSRNTSKINLYELLGVQWTVEINSLGNRSGNRYSRSVYGLPSIISIHTTSNLLDKDRSETLAADSLMDAEEIHLFLTMSPPLLPRPWELRSHAHGSSEALLKWIPEVLPTLMNVHQYGILSCIREAWGPCK